MRTRLARWMMTTLVRAAVVATNLDRAIFFARNDAENAGFSATSAAELGLTHLGPGSALRLVTSFQGIVGNVHGDP